MKKLFALTSVALVLIFSACKKETPLQQEEENGNGAQSMEKLIVPAGFDWSTQKAVQLTIRVSGTGSQMHALAVYDANPFEGGVLLTKGGASASQPFSGKVDLGKHINEIFILSTTPGRSTSLHKAPVSANMSVNLGLDQGSNNLLQQMDANATSPNCTSGCTSNVALTNNQSLEVSGGRTVCVNGTNLTFNVTFGTGGGTLRVCGAGLRVQNLNNNAGGAAIGIQISSGASVTFSNLNFNNKDEAITNFGTITVENNIAMAGEIMNYGSITTRGDYNINTANQDKVGNKHTNYGTVIVGSTLNVNAGATYENLGLTTINSDLAVNGQGTLVNRCQLDVKQVFSNNNLVHNYGYIKVGERSQLNGNTQYYQYSGAMLSTKDFHNNSLAEGIGVGSSSLIKVSANTTINGGATIKGFIQLCDLNGIETNNGTISHGATLGCDVFIAVTKCNPEGNGKETCPDRDKDGVCDADDCYPDDPTKAFCNVVPTGTVAFEDNWPWTGDYDMNDLLMEYDYKVVTNADNQVVRVEGTYKLRATGGSNQNGFAVQFPVDRSKVTNVTGGTLEAGQSKAVIVVFNNMRNEMRSWNTWTHQALIPQVEYTFGFDITNGPALTEFGLGAYNPFIWNNGRAGGRGFETHLPGQQPTNLANTALLGTGMDATVAGTATTYVTKNTRLPWGIHIPARFDYPVEKIAINQAHLKFATWVQSGGTQYPDWYKNLPGYRVESNVFVW